MTKRVTRITTEEKSTGMTEFSRAVEEAGKQKIKVNSNGAIKELTIIEATLQALAQSALKGSPQSLGQFHELNRQASEARKAEIDKEVENWVTLRAKHDVLFAKHRKAHGCDPELYPHPDDIQVDERYGVTVRGPINAKEHAEMVKQIKLCDALLWQDALDAKQERSGKSAPLRPSGALLIANLVQQTLPKRIQRSPDQMVDIIKTRHSQTKRDLLRETKQAWSRAGVSVKRGARFLTGDDFKQLLQACKSLCSVFLSEDSDETDRHMALQAFGAFLGQA